MVLVTKVRSATSDARRFSAASEMTTNVSPVNPAAAEPTST
jgi:hypothetical protein